MRPRNTGLRTGGLSKWGVAALLLFTLAVWGEPVAAAALPDVTIVGPDHPAIKLAREKCTVAGADDNVGNYKGRFVLMAKNDGAAVKKFTLIAYPDPAMGDSHPYPIEYGPDSLPADAVTPVDVTVCVPNSYSRTITFALHVDDPAGAKPATLSVMLERKVTGGAYRAPVFAAAGSAIVLLTLRWWMWKRKRGAFTVRLRQTICTEKTWSFAGSWATTLTALGAVLGTVLAASGLLDDVAPGVDVTRFTALNVLFGGVVLIAPLLYEAASRLVERRSNNGSNEVDQVVHGTLGGLMLAVALTLTGVIGQLATLGVLVDLSDISHGAEGALLAVLAGAGLIVGWYAFASMERLRKLRDPLDEAARPAML